MNLETKPKAIAFIIEKIMLKFSKTPNLTKKVPSKFFLVIEPSNLGDRLNFLVWVSTKFLVLLGVTT